MPENNVTVGDGPLKERIAVQVDEAVDVLRRQDLDIEHGREGSYTHSIGTREEWTLRFITGPLSIAWVKSDLVVFGFDDYQVAVKPLAGSFDLRRLIDVDYLSDDEDESSEGADGQPAS